MFIILVSGPSASTARHFENISQYPCVFKQAAPGLSLKPVAFCLALNIDLIVKESAHVLFVNSIFCFFKSIKNNFKKFFAHLLDMPNDKVFLYQYFYLLNFLPNNIVPYYVFHKLNQHITLIIL
jgi:hypothetical protein